jgi:battenin
MESFLRSFIDCIYSLTGATLVNATLSLSSSYVLVSLLALCADLVSGAIYMIVLGRVLEERSLVPGINQQFCLQVLGAGETAETIFGGLLGTMLEASKCGWQAGTARRCR